jgi:hypothetical protein
MEMEKEFHKDIVAIYEKAKNECRYIATRFIQMVAEKGGLSAAKELIIKDGDTYGFGKLYDLHRLDLSVEALVLKEKYSSLFSDFEKRKCSERLKKYGHEEK